jgi:hypothetical protein
MRGFKIQWQKIDPGVKIPYEKLNLGSKYHMKIDPGVNLPWGSKYHMTLVPVKIINIHKLGKL